MSSKREVIILDGIIFKTKKECKEYVREIIKKLNIGEKIYKSNKLYQFFLDLVNRHPKKDFKIGCGISYFLIAFDSWKNKYVEIVRIDDTSDDFSWNSAIDKKIKTPFELLKQAMRFEINNQILDYKYRFDSPYICNICKNSTSLVEIDHCEIDFKDLLFNFIEKNPDCPKIFDDEPSYHSPVFKLCDKDFSEKWNEYHKINAKLQLLCVDCHTKKTRIANKTINKEIKVLL